VPIPQDLQLNPQTYEPTEGGAGGAGGGTGALNGTAEAKQLIARYVAKADEQETRIEQLTRERQTVAAERQRVQAELDAALRAIDVRRDLTE
jgi:molybdenum-dependent DNA-binding transcriptional regulator ModE